MSEALAPDKIPGWQLAQIRSALASARAHLAILQGGHSHQKVAIRVQEKIIKEYEARIAHLKSKEETWLTN